MRREVNRNNEVDHGGVLREEGQVLAALAGAVGGPILEIGAQRGCSTRFILQGLDAGGTLVSVDPVHQKTWDDPRVTQLSCKSDEVESKFEPGVFRWAFIDGDHVSPWPLHDLNLVRRLGCKFAVLHDSDPNNCFDVYRALESYDKDYLELNTQAGLAIVRFK